MTNQSSKAPMRLAADITFHVTLSTCFTQMIVYLLTKTADFPDDTTETADLSTNVNYYYFSLSKLPVSSIFLNRLNIVDRISEQNDTIFILKLNSTVTLQFQNGDHFVGLFANSLT